jgi:hypothetical protein
MSGIGKLTAVNDVQAVAPLRGVRVGLVTDVRRRHRDELVVVAKLVHRGQPDIKQFPTGRLDDVLDKDDFVAVNFGGAHDIPEGCRLFAVQRRGTAAVGRWFGPVMIV